MRYVAAVMLSIACISAAAEAAGNSELWGESGEKYTPSGRLPDYSFAGYLAGEAPIPHYEVTADVTEFGAVGDGKTDSTDAFRKAIAAAEKGAVFVPEGKYLITDILKIERRDTVLRGAGPDKTSLIFRKSLTEIKPKPSQTSEGLPLSGYSWSGGFLQINGKMSESLITEITSTAKRGDTTVSVISSESLSSGDLICVNITDDESKSLISHLYDDNAGNVSAIPKNRTVSMTAEVMEVINATTVTLSRPLLFDLRPEWKPVITSFRSSVSDSGIENLAIEFPVTPYRGHFTEAGYNAIRIGSVSDCWVKKM